jgi:4-hydroxybenzoate polyprenyltransferase
MIAAIVLLAAGLTAGFLLAPAFSVAMLGYVVLTLAYSFSFKRVAMLDVATIAALFTMRIVMGGVLNGLPLSPWLNSFSAFFFFSLSLAKRNVELMRASATGKDEVPGRGYSASDWPMTLAFGVASAVASIVVMLLFVTDQARASGYVTPDWLFVAPICVFLWISRIWMLSFRMDLDDDPVVFALKDKVSYLLGVIVLMGFLLAL